MKTGCRDKLVNKVMRTSPSGAVTDWVLGHAENLYALTGLGPFRAHDYAEWFQFREFRVSSGSSLWQAVII